MNQATFIVAATSLYQLTSDEVTAYLQESPIVSVAEYRDELLIIAQSSSPFPPNSGVLTYSIFWFPPKLGGRGAIHTSIQQRPATPLILCNS